MAEAIGSYRNGIRGRKGASHPNNLRDGVADVVSEALCGAYLGAYDELMGNAMAIFQITAYLMCIKHALPPR